MTPRESVVLDLFFTGAEMESPEDAKKCSLFSTFCRWSFLDSERPSRPVEEDCGLWDMELMSSMEFSLMFLLF